MSCGCYALCPDSLWLLAFSNHNQWISVEHGRCPSATSQKQLPLKITEWYPFVMCSWLRFVSRLQAGCRFWGEAQPFVGFLQGLASSLIRLPDVPICSGMMRRMPSSTSISSSQWVATSFLMTSCPMSVHKRHGRSSRDQQSTETTVQLDSNGAYFKKKPVTVDMKKMRALTDIDE